MYHEFMILEQREADAEFISCGTHTDISLFLEESESVKCHLKALSRGHLEGPILEIRVLIKFQFLNLPIMI